MRPSIASPGRQHPPHGIRFWGNIVESQYVTAVWTWFMMLAGKAAEPVLVASVLYASVKLLPLVHCPPQLDAAVFITQFIAMMVALHQEDACFDAFTAFIYCYI